MRSHIGPRGWPALLALVVVAAGSSSGSRRADPPVFVPWHKIGDIGQLLDKGRSGNEVTAGDVQEFPEPWFFINVRRGRISSFYFASKFVD